MADEEYRFNHPAEFPEGSEGGGTGPVHRPGGEIAEISPFSRLAQYEALVSEIARLRSRLSSLEEQLLTQAAGRFGRPPRPNEYPEGSEGGGSGLGGVVGGHIPRPEINEYQVDRLGSLVERLGSIESQVATLSARLDALEQRG